MIDVSVIMPVYNAEKYLPMALDSLVNQSLKNIEIICVDDGSTDSSYDILQEYALKDDRFIILRQENQYAGVARNHGMSVARGKYLSFLDADDYFKSDMLREAYTCAERGQADVVVFGGESFKQGIDEAWHEDYFLNDRFLPDKDYFEPGENAEHIFNFTNPAPWNKLFRRSFVEGKQIYFQSTKRGNDTYFVMMAIAAADKIGIVRRNLIAYRNNNSGSLQGSKDSDPLFFASVIRAMEEGLREKQLYETFKQSFALLDLETWIGLLDGLKTGGMYERLYNFIKQELTKKMPLKEYQQLKCVNGSLYDKGQFILSHGSVEYLVCQRHKYRKADRCFLFPFEMIEKGSRIVLYGAGRVGKQFYRQLTKSNYCRSIQWVDKKADWFDKHYIISPNGTDWEMCDYVIIAVENEEIVKAIKEELMSIYHIGSDMIIWRSPAIVY